MEPVKNISPPQWLDNPATKAVMEALNGDEGDGNALFVGGCVRGMLLGAPVADVDIASLLVPDDVMAKLEAAGIKFVPTGLDHGTITAVVDKQGFEITTLRKDVETDGRRAVVAFTTDWAEDAQRRDFTMNTLLADLEGNIYDPTGQGLADLEAGRVVFVGDPATRIAEDYLRILRFFRFHAWYGKGEPNAEALDACNAAADKIADLSKERITHEMLKILAVESLVDILSLIFENNIMGDFAHADYDPAILERLSADADIMARLLVVAGFDPDHTALAQYLVLSNAQKKELQNLAAALGSFETVSEKAVKVLVYRYNNDIAYQVLLLHAAKTSEAVSADLLDVAQNWEAPTLPVSGEDLIKAGIPEGPELGQKLKEIEDRWIDQDFMPDQKMCLSRV